MSPKESPASGERRGQYDRPGEDGRALPIGLFPWYATVGEADGRPARSVAKHFVSGEAPERVDLVSHSRRLSI